MMASPDLHTIANRYAVGENKLAPSEFVDINEIDAVNFVDEEDARVNPSTESISNGREQEEWFSGLFAGEKVGAGMKNSQRGGDSDDEWDFEVPDTRCSESEAVKVETTETPKTTETTGTPETPGATQCVVKTQSDEETCVDAAPGGDKIAVVGVDLVTETGKDEGNFAETVSEDHQLGLEDIKIGPEDNTIEPESSEDCRSEDVEIGLEDIQIGSVIASAGMGETLLIQAIGGAGQQSVKSYKAPLTYHFDLDGVRIDPGLIATIKDPGQEGAIIDPALEAARSEWDAVESITPGAVGAQSAPAVKSSPVEYDEAVSYFHTIDISASRSEIRPELERSVWSSIYQRLFGPPQLLRPLRPERDRVFTIAACGFDSNCPEHVRILMTVYRILTGVSLDPPRYGNHWDQIGFQGTDPATDLRSAGILGLLHLLYLLSDRRTLPLARAMYKLSIDETQNFPFCLMGLNVTCMTLNVMRHGCLNRECNRRKQVCEVINEFYVALFYHFYHIWKTENKTMMESGYVIRDMEKFSLKNSKSVAKRLDDYLSSHEVTKPTSMKTSLQGGDS